MNQTEIYQQCYAYEHQRRYANMPTIQRKTTKQVHKRNAHSKRAGNLSVNRKWKRDGFSPLPINNRATRRAPLRAAYAAKLAAKAAAKAAQAPQA